MPAPLLPGVTAVTVTDVVIAAVIVAAAWLGARRGFLVSSLGLLWLVLPALVALQFSGPVAGALTGPWSPTWTRPAAFAALLILTGALVDGLGWALLGRLPGRAHGAPLNRLLGVLPGAATGMLAAGGLVAVLFTLPVPAGVQADLNRSRLAAPLWDGARLAGPVFGEALRALQPRRTPGRHVDLPFTVQDAPPAPLLEARMLELVNAARAKAGRPALRADPALRAVARRHSADMFARGYFAHVNPDGGSPFDRMKGAGVRYFTAGENLALAPTVGAAHVNLMNSPGHRANLLERQFGRVGIGIVDGGRRGVMVTQNFRN